MQNSVRPPRQTRCALPPFPAPSQTPAGLAATEINVGSEAAITDLTGIEYFPALTTLNSGFCSLTTLDISGYSALYDLRCYESRLSSLDASGMALTGEFDNPFIIYCGGQKASDGKTTQTLTLTLREEQKDRWDTVLKTASYGGNSYNANVTLAP
jgi:hypothetical protein